MEQDFSFYDAEEDEIYDGYDFDPDTCEHCGCDPCECWSDYCCWHPMYSKLGGPKNFCFCKELAEQERKESLWYYRFAWKCAEIYHIAIRKIKSVKLRKPKQTDAPDGLPF